MDRFFSWMGMAKNDYAEKMKKVKAMSPQEQEETQATEREKLVRQYNITSKQFKINSTAVGLENLGNTCFMNSVLQCLAQTVPLRDYVFEDNFKESLNPLTSQSAGVLACEFYKFLINYWTKSESVISPIDIKRAFAKVKRAFAGYDQQDSHEFLSYFIDSIHEDLNQVTLKPYEIIPDYTENENIKEFLKKCYEIHFRRNQSFIIKSFHGQFYSKITCPDQECKRESINGDPFDILSLNPPINLKKTKFDFYYFPASYEQTINKYTLNCIEEINTEDVLIHFKTEFKEHKYKRIQQIYYEKLRFVQDLPKGSPMNVQEVNLSDGLVIYCETFDAEISKLIFGDRVESVIKQEYADNYKLKIQLNLNAKYEGIERIVEVPKDITYHETCMLIYMLHRAVFKEAKIFPATLSSYPTEKSEIEKEMLIFDEYLISSKRNSLWTTKISASGATLSNIGKPLFEKINEKTIELNIWFTTKLSKDELKFRRVKSSDISPYKSNFGEITLEKCLTRFIQKEELDKDNMWYCPNCKTHQKATKEVLINQAPEILIIHLKRFKKKSSNYGISFEKINDLILFPHKLDISPYMFQPEGNCIYELYGVSNHFGHCGGGHYTAFCKNLENKQWYNFDDEDVRKIKDESVVTEAAYILFYQKIKSSK